MELSVKHRCESNVDKDGGDYPDLNKNQVDIDNFSNSSLINLPINTNSDEQYINREILEERTSNEENTDTIHINEPNLEFTSKESSATIPYKTAPHIVMSKNSSALNKLLVIEQELKDIASRDIIYSPALITRGLDPVIRRGTINVIQGAQGSHKSRLAAIMSICFIKNPDHKVDTLGYEKVKSEEITVIYIDTERNQTEEFAEALQMIVRNAGYNSPDEISNFRFTSLKGVPKKERFNLIKEFVKSVRNETTNPLFIIIDVITDIVENFNNPVESMALLDYLGSLTESLSATILITIHENPGSAKARGHVGSEAINKASYVTSIAFQLDKQGERTSILWLKDVKNRHAERVEPIALEFDNETKLLKLGDVDYARWVLNQNKIKPNSEAYLERLAEYLITPLNQKELISKLVLHFKCSENTVKNRLSEIEKNQYKIEADGNLFILNRTSVNGKPTFYQLIETVKQVE